MDFKGESHGVKGECRCGVKQDWKEPEEASVRNEMEMCSERRSRLRFQAGNGAHAGHFSQVHKAKIRDNRCSQSKQKRKWAKDTFYCLYSLLFIHLIESSLM